MHSYAGHRLAVLCISVHFMSISFVLHSDGIIEKGMCSAITIQGRLVENLSNLLYLLIYLSFQISGGRSAVSIF